MDYAILTEELNRIQNTTQVTIELVDGGKMPSKANSTDCAFDCYAVSKKEMGDKISYGLGFKIEVPPGYGAFIYPRSSIKNYDLLLTNSVGIIDEGYSGEVSVNFYVTATIPYTYKVGDRVCQMIIQKLPIIELVEGKISENNKRGGFGSSGI